MTYRLELTATAKADIREQVRYLQGRFKPAIAEKWLAGLNKAFESLTKRPHLYPLAAESDKFPRPIRELSYGRRRENQFRILLEIREDVVNVIFVRHAARGEVESRSEPSSSRQSSSWPSSEGKWGARRSVTWSTSRFLHSSPSSWPCR